MSRHFISELSKITGLPYHTLYGRWSAGDRGDRLTRPADQSKRRKSVRNNTLPDNTAPVALNPEHRTRAEVQADNEARIERQRAERKQRSEELRQKYLADIRRPLIDAGLLTEGERVAIYQRIGGSQRCDIGV